MSKDTSESLERCNRYIAEQLEKGDPQVNTPESMAKEIKFLKDCKSAMEKYIAELEMQIKSDNYPFVLRLFLRYFHKDIKRKYKDIDQMIATRKQEYAILQASKGTAKTAETASKEAAETASKEATETASKETVETVEAATQEAGEKATKEAGKSTAKETSEKSTKDSSKDSAKDSAKDSSKKTAESLKDNVFSRFGKGSGSGSDGNSFKLNSKLVVSSALRDS